MSGFWSLARNHLAGDVRVFGQRHACGEEAVIPPSLQLLAR